MPRQEERVSKTTLNISFFSFHTFKIYKLKRMMAYYTGGKMNGGYLVPQMPEFFIIIMTMFVLPFSLSFFFMSKIFYTDIFCFAENSENINDEHNKKILANLSFKKCNKF